MTVAIINKELGGFGDIINAQIFFNYMIKWYPTESVHIVCLSKETYKKHINTIGADKKDMVKMFEKNSDGYPQYTKFIITPMVYSSFSEIEEILNDNFTNFNENNSVFITEYNSSIEYNEHVKKKFNFIDLGIGKNRAGLLITDTQKISQKIYDELDNQLKNPYLVAYIADLSEHVDVNKLDYSVSSYTTRCFENFLTAMSKKYYDNGYKNLDIVVPRYINSLNDNIRYVLENLKTDYENVIEIAYKTKNQIKRIKHKDSFSENATTITIRGDILPVNHEKMKALFMESDEDVLITGDQSLTDIISCCNNKNIHYQTAPWKRNLLEELGKVTRAKWLSSPSTSCGGLKYIKMEKTDNMRVKKLWNFNNLGKPILDRIFGFKQVINVSSNPKSMYQVPLWMKKEFEDYENWVDKNKDNGECSEKYFDKKLLSILNNKTDNLPSIIPRKIECGEITKKKCKSTLKAKLVELAKECGVDILKTDTKDKICEKINKKYNISPVVDEAVFNEHDIDSEDETIVIPPPKKNVVKAPCDKITKSKCKSTLKAKLIRMAKDCGVDVLDTDTKPKICEKINNIDLVDEAVFKEDDIDSEDEILVIPPPKKNVVKAPCDKITKSKCKSTLKAKLIRMAKDCGVDVLNTDTKPIICEKINNINLVDEAVFNEDDIDSEDEIIVIPPPKKNVVKAPCGKVTKSKCNKTLKAELIKMAKDCGVDVDPIKDTKPIICEKINMN